MSERHLFTSECVSMGHPDKVADQISDSVVDAFLAQDPDARVAVETLVTTDLTVLAGEVKARPGELMGDRVRSRWATSGGPAASNAGGAKRRHAASARR